MKQLKLVVELKMVAETIIVHAGNKKTAAKVVVITYKYVPLYIKNCALLSISLSWKKVIQIKPKGPSHAPLRHTVIV